MMGLTLFIRKRKVPTHPDLIVFLFLLANKRKKEPNSFFIGPKEEDKRKEKGPNSGRDDLNDDGEEQREPGLS